MIVHLQRAAGWSKISGVGVVVESYVDLAARIRLAAPRLGRTRMVAIDGGAGSGKSTFAGRLGRVLSAPIVHTDDLLEGWGDITGYWPQLQTWVLEPLRAGLPGRYRRYDWDAARFAEWHDVAVPEVLIVEGVASARAAGRGSLSYAVWIEAPSAVRLARGLARDGERLRPYWMRWLDDEARYVAVDHTAEHADVVVDGDPALTHDPESTYVRLR